MSDATVDSTNGASGDDYLVASDDGDKLVGGSGDDTLVSGLEDDTLHGGSGYDTAVYEGLIQDYLIEDVDGDGDLDLLITDGKGNTVVFDTGGIAGEDTLKQIEAIQFDNGTYVIGDANQGVFFQKVENFSISEDFVTADYGINLIEATNAFDLEGDTISVVDGSVTSSLGLEFTVVDGVITFSEAAIAEFQLLNAGESLTDTITFTLTDAGSGKTVTSSFEVTITGNDEIVQVTAVDGYIVGATVFADADKDGVLDAGEANGLTDGSGGFALVNPNGTLILEGGVDISTGLAFEGRLYAPEGATVITSLSTVVAKMMELGSTQADAISTVQEFFFYGDDIDFLTVDPIASVLAAEADGPEFMSVASQLLNTVTMIVGVLEGAGATQATADLFDLVFDEIAKNPDPGYMGIFDPAVQYTIEGLLSSSAYSAQVSLDSDAFTSATQVIIATNAATQAAVSSGVTGESLLADITQVNIVTQGEITDAFSNTQHTQTAYDQIVENYTGNNLETTIDQAVVGDLDGLTSISGGSVVLGFEDFSSATGYSSNIATYNGFEFDLSFNGAVFELDERVAQWTTEQSLRDLTGSDNAIFVSLSGWISSEDGSEFSLTSLMGSTTDGPYGPYAGGPGPSTAKFEGFKDGLRVAVQTETFGMDAREIQFNPDFSDIDQLRIDSNGFFLFDNITMAANESFAPVAASDSFDTDEDAGSITFTHADILGNDVDLDGHELSIAGFSSTGLAPGVTIHDNPLDQTVTVQFGDAYQHLKVGETETFSFTYLLQDETGATDTGTISVSVEGRNDGPSAISDTLFISGRGGLDSEGYLYDFGYEQLLGNDTDPDGEILNVQEIGVVPTGEGSELGLYTTGFGTGDFGFTLSKAFYDSLADGESYQVENEFFYEVVDEQGVTSTASFDVIVTGINDQPIALDDSLIIHEDHRTIDISFLELMRNDSDPDNNALLNITDFDTSLLPAGVTLTADYGTQILTISFGETYQSLDDGESASFGFAYTLSDEHGAQIQGQVSVLVNGANEEPDQSGSSLLDDFIIGGFDTYLNNDVLLSNDGSVSSTGQNNLTSMSRVNGMAAGDIDNDGDLDVVVARDSSASQILINNGDGTFTAQGLISESGSNGFDVALGDYNGDGHLDAYIAYWGSADRLYYGDSSGNFTSANSIALGTNYSRSVEAGDVNGDGHLDIVVANSTNSAGRANEVLLNDGSGNFSQIKTFGLDLSYGLKMADLNGDGYLDAIVTNWMEASTVWLNDGTGGFTDTGQDLGFYSQSVAFADIDHDGDMDAILNNYTGHLASSEHLGATVWKNDGAGNFTLSQEIGTSANLRVEFADVNDDGYADAYILNHEVGGVWIPDDIYLNDGTGSFTTRIDGSTLNGYSRSILVADLDGDGGTTVQPPVAETSYGDDLFIAGYYNQAHSTVLLSDGNSLGDTGTVSGLYRTRGMDAGDVDGDGDLDLLTANDTSNSLLMLNDGSGNFTVGQTFTDSSNGWDVSLGDYDGDGDLDAYYAYWSGLDKIRFNDGTGQFSSQFVTVSSMHSRSAESADIDGDGDLDIVVANSTNSAGKANEVFLNDGSGNFSLYSTFGMDLSYDLDLADVDGDGDLDAFVGNYLEVNTLWLNDGSGNFADSGQILGSGGNSVLSIIEVGDLDGDGDIDAVLSNNGSANEVLLNDGNGTFSQYQFLGVANDDTAGLALVDADHDGDLDIYFSNNNNVADTLWFNDGSANFANPESLTNPLGHSWSVISADFDGSYPTDSGETVESPAALNILNDTPEDDILIGMEGADSFTFGADAFPHWEQGRDTVLNFNAEEGDILNLTDLLEPTSIGGIPHEDLGIVMDFSLVDGQDTLLEIGNDIYTPLINHSILLTDVDLVTGTSGDQEILNNLLASGNLEV